MRFERAIRHACRMELFDDANDVEEWLELLDYESFWTEIAALDLEIQSREGCDEQIARGIVDEATLLFVLKGMARLELIERFNLKRRDTMPFYSLH